MIASAPERIIPETMPPDPRRQVVRRVLASPHFSKSRRLSSLFEHVCDLTLAGRADEIHEQSLGEAVFGRPRDYDSTADGIVRTQASRLRQRLDLYFSEDGIDEPMRISIPRGSYIPLFESRSVEEPRFSPSPVPATIPSAAPALPAAIKRSRPAYFAWSLVVALAVVLAALVLRDERPKMVRVVRLTPHAFWSQMFVPGDRTLLVPGDSSLVIWQGMKNRNIDLTEYVSGTYRAPNPIAPATSMEALAANIAGARYTSIVDLEAAQSLALIADSQKSGLEVRYPRELRPNDLKQGNLILVGISEADPWVTLFERDMNFVFYINREKHVLSVLNKSPRANEPEKWDSSGLDRQHRIYAVVAYLPNLGGNGNVLILEGTTMAGTECAWDFVSDDSKLQPFLQKIQRPDGKVPYFEVVLGTNNISGSAVDGTVLAMRIHP